MKYKDGLWPNTFMLAWVLVTYIVGIGFCLAPEWLLNLCGVILLAHSMILAAYLIHECAHNTIFASSKMNMRLAEALNWITGAIYSPFEAIRYKHMRHHVDRADVVTYEYRAWLKAAPASTLKWLGRAEALGIPALEVGMRFLALVIPFVDPMFEERRVRVVVVLVLRVVFFVSLTFISPIFLMFYLFAYLISLQVLRFMDAYQHTYPLREDLYDASIPNGPAPGLDREFEERNTFSNPISERWSLLNLLVLNFGFHNAHHRRPSQPWHRLPAQHRELYSESNDQVLMPRETRSSFVRYRRDRILNEDLPDIGVKRGSAKDFIGVDGVSFLIPF
tara:strand:+ start:592 stop:1593 length:1002 start_codon:yes stop_codon:yes gene_type:complete